MCGCRNSNDLIYIQNSLPVHHHSFLKPIWKHIRGLARMLLLQNFLQILHTLLMRYFEKAGLQKFLGWYYNVYELYYEFFNEKQYILQTQSTNKTRILTSWTIGKNSNNLIKMQHKMISLAKANKSFWVVNEL